MGFLEGLFEETVPELPIADAVISADAAVEPGYLYRIVASETPMTLTMLPHSLASVVDKRFAVKVYSSEVEVPASLTIVAAPGQQLELDDGSLGSSVELVQTLGNYREWLCDADGTWLRVGGGW